MGLKKRLLTIAAIACVAAVVAAVGLSGKRIRYTFGIPMKR